MHLLVTGSAGFIGYHFAKMRLERGDQVIGIDNLNDYYDVRLKQSRLEQLKSYPNFVFYPFDICDREHIDKIFKKHKPERVVHLAAQAGVRYSLKNPHLYVQSNVVGFTHVIDACKTYQIEHLVYASTSSVYGANSAQPYNESDAVTHPLTIYAATKKANELIAHSYSNLYKLPTTGLRFFTVYGPWGRPDMAFFSFTRDILNGTPIKVYNHGQMQRDFTYIDDIIMGISLAVDKPAEANPCWSGQDPDAATSFAPYRIYNIGRGCPVNLMDYISALEQATGKHAIKQFMPMQEGDVLSTHADTSRLQDDLGYAPQVSIQEGIERFVAWYLDFYR
ncbi:MULTISPECIES: NAD-dependent epimerase [Legionella]|uniref:NAD-dependent epimerase n=1 Tax=Legionella septentrionalis TaxID=2498109 RepID=A0A3S0V9L2_9GAMM|nr:MULTISPECIES: NAD-dependent epimerase [Legionella]MCP0913700.1 NAD-dependent epimerase [Legionella sp. 27cVA30]RUQ80995.1 NAD-dependent epimerase [Legionella septentrionalis]RUQ97488.1 NAD-dependent epimerase [Legionella septentrionalis]RUR09784.1 NAD-dependent epimerase [Legionella septentrionalis]RUR15924.1 NAD-dependent epimerase [Legionella septentrionalis]